MKKFANIKYFLRDERHLNNLLIILKKEEKNERRKSKKYDWIRIEEDNHIPRIIFKYLIKFFIFLARKKVINNLKHILYKIHSKYTKAKDVLRSTFPTISIYNLK